MTKEIINQIITFYDECPIKSWRDITDEDATEQDIRDAQIEYVMSKLTEINMTKV